MMIKLSDTQLVVLSAAARRQDLSVLPLPASLKGGAAIKVVDALIRRDLIAEVAATRSALVWRESADGTGATTLIITPAGLDALCIDAEPAPEPEPAATPMAKAKAKPAAKKAAPAEARTGTKQAQVIAMLKRKQGATITQISEVTEWQVHTVRGFFAGALKKKLGLAVNSEKVGSERVYRITGEVEH